MIRAQFSTRENLLGLRLHPVTRLPQKSGPKCAQATYGGDEIQLSREGDKSWNDIPNPNHHRGDDDDDHRDIYPEEQTSEAKAGPSNKDTGPDTAEGSERKERKVRNVWAVPFYRKSAKNKLLVAAVLEQDPFSAPFGQVRAAWERVATALNKEVVFQASRSEHSGCQNQIKKLLDYWERRRSISAQLHNKLDSWERTLEQLLNFKIESEHKKSLKKAPVSTPEEEMLLSNQGGRLSSKRQRLELKEDMLEAVVDEEVIPHVMKVLMGHSKQLQRIEGLMVDLFSLQNSLLETLKRDEKKSTEAEAQANAE